MEAQKQEQQKDFSEFEKDLIYENFALRQQNVELRKQLLSLEERQLRTDLTGKFSWVPSWAEAKSKQ